MANDNLEIRNVIKRQGKLQTVNDVSLTVEPGERVAMMRLPTSKRLVRSIRHC